MATNIENGKTKAKPYVFNSGFKNVPNPTGPETFDIVPLITVGDFAPLLEGTLGNFTRSQTEVFAMAGIPDGLGYVEIDGFKYVFMNHELSANTIDPVTGLETSPPVTTATNATGTKIINGARVSLWQFDQNWNLLGGKNLIEDVVLDGVTYSLNTLTGNYEDPLGNVLTYFNHENFTRFCSGYLAAQGFIDPATNLPIPIWFAPQERSDGVGTAVQGNNGLAIPVKGLGTLSKENILAASQYRAIGSDFTVLLATEDSSNGELYLYVGRQTIGNPNGFWSSAADGANFDLYVLRVKDALGNVYGYETMLENQLLTAEWVHIPDAIAVNPNPSFLSDFVNIGPNDANTATNVLTAPDNPAPGATTFNSTNFRRLEDIAEDPNRPGTFYFVTTGRNDVVPVDGYSRPNPLAGLDNPVQGPTTQRDNPLGKLHRFELNINITVDPLTGIPTATPVNGTFETLLEGGLNKGVSYDNIVVDSNGNVLIQEDETADGDVIFAAENRDGGVLSYNIAANEGVVGTDTVDLLFEINSTAGNVPGLDFSEIAGWETSGVIEVDPNALAGRSSYLLDVQASTISTDPNRLDETQTYKDLIAQGLTPTEALAQLTPIAGAVLGGQYERGGQLLLFVPTEQPELVFGGAGVDNFTAIPGTAVDGTKDTVIAGDGADIIDISGVTNSAAGKNNIFAGDGNDEALVGKNDRVFGGAGDDTFFANQGQGGNRIYGGAGADTFFLGGGDRVVGGAGDDRFFVNPNGTNNADTGGNTITGGTGADQFWVVNGSVPNLTDLNVITDFEVGIDVIGFSGIATGPGAVTPAQITATQSLTNVNNTIISVAGTAVAELVGINAADVPAAIDGSALFPNSILIAPPALAPAPAPVI